MNGDRPNGETGGNGGNGLARRTDPTARIALAVLFGLGTIFSAVYGLPFATKSDVAIQAAVLRDQIEAAKVIEARLRMVESRTDRLWERQEMWDRRGRP